MTTVATPPAPADHRVGQGAFNPRSLLSSVPQAFAKLDPRLMYRNPVMFVVEVGAVISTVLAVSDPSVFSWLIVVWLWLTVVFANLAAAVAEGRGRAQASSLRATRRDTMARRLGPQGDEVQVSATELRVGDRVVCEAGDVIPGDGDVVEGVASVDESAITGESAPVIRESGGDRCSVTGGTKVLSDRIVVQIAASPGHTFIDRMIALVEGASRQKTPNEVALSILLASLTVIFLLAVATLQPFATYSGAQQTVIVLVALLVCLIPTTIGALLSAIGIAGMDRLLQRNVLAMSGRAVEAAGDVSTLLLDKDRHHHPGEPTGHRAAAGTRGRRSRPRCCRPALQPCRRDAGRTVGRCALQDRVRTTRAGGGRADPSEVRGVHGSDPDVRSGP